MAVRAVVVDPQPFFGAALAAALVPHGVSVAATTTDQRAAVRLVQALAPAVVLTEVDLDRGSGLGLAAEVGDRTAVVLLTRRHEGDVLLDAAAAGAAGCLSHRVTPATLATLVAGAGPGRFVVDDARLLSALRRASELRGASDSAGLAELTRRQQQVLELVGRGLSDEQIAAQLYLSPGTVRTHVGHIRRKLGVHSRSEAVRVLSQLHPMGPEGAVVRIHGPELGTG